MAISFKQFITIAEKSRGTVLDRPDFAGMTVRRERDRKLSDSELQRTKVVVDKETGERTKVKVRPKPQTAKTTSDGRKTTAQIGAVDRSVDPKERAAKAAAAAKEERRKAALARRGGGDSKPAAQPSGKEAEKKATELLRKDVQSKKPESGPKRTYTKQETSADDMRTTSEKRADAKKARRAKVAEKKKSILADYIAAYTKENGAAPKGPARTRLVAKATAAAEAMAGSKGS
jgi:hypothetical protein